METQNTVAAEEADVDTNMDADADADADADIEMFTAPFYYLLSRGDSYSCALEVMVITSTNGDFDHAFVCEWNDAKLTNTQARVLGSVDAADRRHGVICALHRCHG